uniref:Uncharacterized protein n=1 Tax=Roseihalotalea indica TaxID=2867963 RepID=A0AA49GIB7_9BACT|nr:hypothetical protein K4G66_18920 [Tunicatimonas sp. TK19036]
MTIKIKTREIAEMVGKTPSTVNRWMRNGNFPTNEQIQKELEEVAMQRLREICHQAPL